jgi:hypothetical protein
MESVLIDKEKEKQSLKDQICASISQTAQDLSFKIIIFDEKIGLLQEYLLGLENQTSYD